MDREGDLSAIWADKLLVAPVRSVWILAHHSLPLVQFFQKASKSLAASSCSK